MMVGMITIEKTIGLTYIVDMLVENWLKLFQHIECKQKIIQSPKDRQTDRKGI